MEIWHMGLVTAVGKVLFVKTTSKIDKSDIRL